jgi:hypothetical protein
MSCYIIYHYNILDKERIELLGPLSLPIVESFYESEESRELSKLRNEITEGFAVLIPQYKVS